MSLLKKAATLGADVKAKEDADRLGGGQVHETAIYPFTCDSAYMMQSAKGAIGVVLNLSINGSIYSETLYLTNAKGENFYTNKQTQEKEPMPGLLVANSFCKLLIGCDAVDAITEERKLNIWDYESKSEKPTKVEALVDCFGKQGHVALRKIRKNKQVKGDGGYVDSPDEVFVNSIEKFFNADLQTATEAAAGAAGDFHAKWSEKNAGKVKDTYKEVKGVAAGAPKAPAMPSAAAAPTTSSVDADELFN